MTNVWVLAAAGEFMAMSDRAQGFEQFQVPYNGSTPPDEAFKIIDETETRYVSGEGMIEQMSTPQFIGGVLYCLLAENRIPADVWTLDNVSVLNMYIGGVLARRRCTQLAVYEADIYTKDSPNGPVIDAQLFKQRLKSL